MSPPADLREFLVGSKLEPLQGHDFSISGPLFLTPVSQIFKVTIDGSDGHLAIKVTRDASLRDEFEGLKLARKAIANVEHASVPQVYALSKQENMMAMDWIDNLPVQATLTSFSTSAAAAISAATRCGAWIAGLHRTSVDGEKCVDTQGLFEDIVVEDPKTRLSSGRRLTKYKTALELEIEPVGRIKTPSARLHGDFKPSNISINTSGTTTGFDMTFNGSGPVIYDLAQFLNNMCLDLYNKSAPRLLPLVRSLETAFLETYRLEGIPVDDNALRWTRLQKYLLLHYETLNRKSPGLKRSILLFSLMREIKRVSDAPRPLLKEGRTTGGRA